MKNSLLILLFCLTTLPAISSDDDKKHGNMVHYKSDGDTVSAYLTLPAGEGPFPAVILIHDEYGLDDWMKKQTDSLSQKGYAALAIDLYQGKKPKPEEAQSKQNGISNERAIQDIKSALQYLTTHKNINPKRIGCIGWNMGASYALQAAVELSELKAVVMCYGDFIEDKNVLRKISSPILVVDPSSNEEAATEFAAAVLSVSNKINVQLYDNTVSSFMREGEHFDRLSTKHAWNQIDRFFESHLNDQ